MEKSICAEHARYAIFLELMEKAVVTVGRLGTFTFHPGTYIYIGSSEKNITSRISRHVKKQKPLRWHFDYLRPLGEITKIITYEKTIEECELASRLRKELGATTPVKKFGSTDCKCYSHLLFSSKIGL